MEPGKIILTSGLYVGEARASDQSVLIALGFDYSECDRIFVSSTPDTIDAAVGYIKQPFESSFLSRPALRLSNIWQRHPSRNSLGGLIKTSLDVFAGEGFGLISHRTDIEDSSTSRVLVESGFAEMETLLTFEHGLSGRYPGQPVEISIAGLEDAEDCAGIASSVFHSDRFHVDLGIPNSAADKIKENWIRNSVKGRADIVFLVRSDEGKATGFNACMFDGKTAAIDLIGVDGRHQGKGLGRLLVQSAISHYSGKARCLRVGTQSTNEQSIALYKAMGFDLVDTSVTFHNHLTRNEH
jgi:ribosomal protein S18 acetylase RimI-like enzyme